MAKTKISEWSSTPANNTDIDSINIAEGCAPSGINDAIRELMSQVKDLYSGTTGDAIGVAGGGTGQTSYTDGQLLIGNTTGNTLTKATLTAGTNVTITNSAGGITIAAAGGSPAGSNTQVQYNNSGSFGASSNLTFDGTRLTTTAITSSGVTNYFGPATNSSVAHLFSGTKTGYSMVTVDSCTLSPPATSDAGILFFAPAVGNTIQKASSATHANFATLYVTPPSIGAGSAGLTNASTIYVTSAPSGATNNYAISVGSGTTYLNGLVNISGASGGQIQFPATQNASTDANTLDDYEEGTWTPNQGGNLTVVGTFSSSGTYTKIGRIVVVQGQVTGSTSITVTQGGLVCSNLPFTVSGNAFGAMTNNAADIAGIAWGQAGSIYAGPAIAATSNIRFTNTYFV